MLEVAQPNDARAAMRGAAVVTGNVALEAGDALSPAREMMDGRGPHRTEPADDDIEMGHSPSLPSVFATRYSNVSVSSIWSKKAGAAQSP
jgi:hypothetical protein